MKNYNGEYLLSLLGIFRYTLYNYRFYTTIYPKGYDKSDLAKDRLDVQIDLGKAFQGNTIFIPGNNDWNSNGVKGLKRQEKFIEEH